MKYSIAKEITIFYNEFIKDFLKNLASNTKTLKANKK